MAFSGSEDSQSKEDGMSQINIISGITGAKGISHPVAREKFISILEKIKKSGWRSIIPFNSPRLTGKDRTKYLKIGQTITLDADYPPSMDEWMKLPDLTTWEFYANRTFLKVNFMRDENKMDISKPGAYVINYTFESEKDYFKGFVSPGEREKWEKLLPIELREAAEIRERTEENLRKNGWQIDTTYQDPPPPGQAASTTQWLQK